ncbi:MULTISPECIES: hypothetical protein [unclassified Microcoleus]|uniref:hypothetical protein n=1 Tax=unclassified Microcoleus TaxID=2642155 RepID=UPI002FD0A9D9
MFEFDIGYYRNFQLPSNSDIPEQLQETLHRVWERKYRDLYETGGKYNVEEAFVEVMTAFGMPNDAISHQRYVYMAYGIALAAKPTIKHYFPEEDKADRVQKIVSCWLKDGCEIPETCADTLFPNINKIGKYQATDEAYNIFYGLLQTLNTKTAYNAILDILYDAITGDAISGFAVAKRDMFNWWLIEVVPAAYCLKLPSTLYSREWEFPPLSQCA